MVCSGPRSRTIAAGVCLSRSRHRARSSSICCLTWFCCVISCAAPGDSSDLAGGCRHRNEDVLVVRRFAAGSGEGSLASNRLLRVDHLLDLRLQTLRKIRRVFEIGKILPEHVLERPLPEIEQRPIHVSEAPGEIQCVRKVRACAKALYRRRATAPSVWRQPASGLRYPCRFRTIAKRSRFPPASGRARTRCQRQLPSRPRFARSAIS